MVRFAPYKQIGKVFTLNNNNKRRSGGQLKTLRKSCLDLLRKLQFDTSDSALCGFNGTFINILELICNKPIEFNLRLDHGLNGDARDWLTAPNLRNVVKFRYAQFDDYNNAQH